MAKDSCRPPVPTSHDPCRWRGTVAPMNAPMSCGAATRPIRPQRRQARTKIRHDLRQSKHGQMNAAKDVARIRRGLIRGLDCDRLAKRILYHQAGAALRENMQSIHERHQAERERKLAPVKPLAWFDWLAQRAAMNDAEALATLRRRKQRAARRANCLLGAVQQDRAGEPMQGFKIDGVTKQGTMIYSDGKSAVRDSGNRLEVSEGITQEGLEIALSMAAQRFGRHIAIEGDTAFRERILHMAKALGIELALTNGGPQHAQSARLPDTQMGRNGAGQGQAPEPMPPDTASPGEEAARRYILERESKRQKIAGIPRHVLGELGQQGEIRYAGWRQRGWPVIAACQERS